MSATAAIHPFKRFDTLPTIDGYEVVAVDTGRPVAVRGSHASANGVAFRLNQVAATGDPRSLAAAITNLR